METAFIINCPTAMCCGKPVAQCKCGGCVHNQVPVKKPAPLPVVNYQAAFEAEAAERAEVVENQRRFAPLEKQGSASSFGITDGPQPWDFKKDW